MPSINKMILEVFQVTLVGFCADCRKDLVVLAPDDQRRRLVFPQLLLPFGIQWQRYWEDAPYPDLVKLVPPVAFEVDDLDSALTGQNIIIQPNSPSDGVVVAFIEVNGAPVELMQKVSQDI